MDAAGAGAATRGAGCGLAATAARGRGCDFGGAKTIGPLDSGARPGDRGPDPRLSSTPQSTETDPLGSVSTRPFPPVVPEPPMITGPLWPHAGPASIGTPKQATSNAKRGMRARNVDERNRACRGADEGGVRRAIPCRAFPDLPLARVRRAGSVPPNYRKPSAPATALWRPLFALRPSRRRPRRAAPTAARGGWDWRRGRCRCREDRCRLRSR